MKSIYSAAVLFPIIYLLLHFFLGYMGCINHNVLNANKLPFNILEENSNLSNRVCKIDAEEMQLNPLMTPISPVGYSANDSSN